MTLQLTNGLAFPTCDWEGELVALQARVIPAAAGHVISALKLPSGRHEVTATVRHGVARFPNVAIDLLGAELRPAGGSVEVLLLVGPTGRERCRDRDCRNPQLLRNELRIRVRAN